jgi:vancomycin resistance protein YoaR
MPVMPSVARLFLDPGASATAAFNVGRQGGLFQRLDEQFSAWFSGAEVSPTLVFDQRIAYQFLENLATQINKPVIEANLGLQGTEVVVRSGEVGRTLDIGASLAAVSAQVQTLQDGLVTLVVTETPPVILDTTAQAEVARQILSQPLTMTMPEGMSADGSPWVIDPSTLASMLTIERVQDDTGASYQVQLNSDMLRTFLTNLAPQLAATPQNARFTFNDDTRQLDLIQHAVIGRSLNVQNSIQAIQDGLKAGQHTIPLVLDINDPPVTDSATAESLGITELVSQQTSYFYGSPSDRVQNIQAAAKSFHGLLVAPGETFSMASALGDISLDNGYAEALIIVGGQTITGVGGGVCQVSTTLFRTAFFGGFPIVERYAHAYRVSYYEKVAGNKIDADLAGLDATVYVPLVDFKFKNDTPYWLLMETYVNPSASSITWKFYSTSDGRTVDWTTTGPVNIVSAPDPLYKENTDLSKGEIKQVDWAADGADVTVNRTVMRDGQVYLSDTFYTHYQPWQAVYEYGPGTDLPEGAKTEKSNGN